MRLRQKQPNECTRGNGATKTKEKGRMRFVALSNTMQHNYTKRNCAYRCGAKMRTPLPLSGTAYNQERRVVIILAVKQL